MVKGAHNDTQHQKSNMQKHSYIDYDGVLLTNAECLIVPIPYHDI